MMHFPLFQISPLFSNNFPTLKKIFTILPFPENFLDFHPPKFLMTFFLFFSHRPKISNFPPFFLFQNISPVSRKYYFPPSSSSSLSSLPSGRSRRPMALLLFSPYFDKFPSLFYTFSPLL